MTLPASAATLEVPIIDLSNPNKEEIISEISQACTQIGFFQVINHNITLSQFSEVQQQTKLFFDLPYETKLTLKRSSENSRGYFDDELTKQKRDWKECLDIGIPSSTTHDFYTDDDSNQYCCLEGWNQFPSNEEELKKTIVEYYKSCAELSHTLATYMSLGLGITSTDFVQELKESHTSFMRLNHYPPNSNNIDDSLGISPHHDAGFLTVLLQDDDCHSLQVLIRDQWITVHPTPGALTINTGDMAMIYSNGQYQAPLHRVLTNRDKHRYSIPFFYNPGFRTFVRSAIEDSKKKYHECLWGYFRCIRFAGDLMDLGVEIQVEDYEIDREKSRHLAKQIEFLDRIDFDKPFSVDEHREFLLA